MKTKKHYIRCKYEGYTEDEISLPEGVEIKQVEVNYGKVQVLTSTGEIVNFNSNNYINSEQVTPSSIEYSTWF